MKHTTLLGIAALLLAPFAESHSAPAPAQYAGWQSAGSIFVLTTPEGADLPASAVVDGFPLLVRLHRHRSMKRIMRIIHTLILLACTSAGAADAIPPRATAQPVAAPPAKPAVQKGEMFGYLIYGGEKVPAEFNAGFSLYAAAWPLVETYPNVCE